VIAQENTGGWIAIDKLQGEEYLVIYHGHFAFKSLKTIIIVKIFPLCDQKLLFP
jgi:hypothetical protein